jgi:hypothetical protein
MSVTRSVATRSKQRPSVRANAVLGSPVDRDPRLVTHHAGVVARRNLIELAGHDQQLRTLTHPDPALPEMRRPIWWASHSSVCATGLIDSLQRQPG